MSEWKDITCGCTSASCTCPDTMNIVTYDVLVQQPTTVVARSDNWRTVVFYTETDTWITYISWNDQKSKVKFIFLELSSFVIGKKSQERIYRN